MKKGRSKTATRLLNRQELIHLGRADLISFSRWPLQYKGDYKLWECQQEWQELAQKMYKARLKDPINGKQLCLLAPSEHGKTYGLDIPFIMWVLARNRNLRVGIVGSKDDTAINIGHGIDRMFKNHAGALAEFGLVPGYPWNAQQKFLQRDDDKLIHPSIFCIGPDTEIQGHRFDVIFLTDFCTFKNQATKEKRDKLLAWMMNTLFPRLEPWGFVIAEGHHVDAEDIYTELEEMKDEWVVKKYSAILEEPCIENKNTAKLLAPEQWAYKQLNRIRHRDPGTFQLIYQNIPVARSGMVSKEVLDRMLDRSRPFVYTPFPGIEKAYQEIHLGFDLAFSKNRWSKYSVCVVVGIDENGRQDLLGGWRLQLLPQGLHAKIVRDILKWRPTKAHIEANAAQIYVVDDVRKSLGTFSSVVNPVYTLKDDPTDKQEFGIGELVGKFASGDATMPYGNHDAQVFSDQLISELVNYPGRYTDVAMAWAILLNGLSKFKRVVRRCIPFRGISRSVSRSLRKPWLREVQ